MASQSVQSDCAAANAYMWLERTMIAISALSITMFTKTIKSMKKRTEKQTTLQTLKYDDHTRAQAFAWPQN